MYATAPIRELRNLGVNSDGKMRCETDRNLGPASVVIQALSWAVVVKKDFSHNAKALQ